MAFHVGQRVSDAAHATAERTKEKVDDALGGRARREVIVLLAAVLGLDTADKAALSSVAGGVRHAFGISNTKIGILVSIVSLVGAVLTLPAGALIDRTRRKRILWIAATLWSAAMIVSGAATSFWFLLAARVFLGAVTAVAAPAVASLIGDYFPGRDRGRVYGMVLAGELIGLGVGFAVAGLLSSWLSWRWAFWGLVPLSAATAFALWRWLPEPARGGQSWLKVGAEHVRSEEDVDAGRYAEEITDDDGDGDPDRELAERTVREDGVRPREELILRDDPKAHSLWWAMRYILSIPTIRWLILGSSLAYFYFAGLRSFIIEYYTGHLSISRGAAVILALVVGIFAIVGVIFGGRLGDRLIRKGHLTGRILVPPVGLGIMVGFAVPAIILTSIWAVLPLLCLGGASLAASLSPLDAARLDVMPAGFWGRSEAVRQFLRGLFEAAAPTTFGLMSTNLFGGGNRGLEYTFLIMLVTLLLGASVVVFARRTYERDVATAAAAQSEGGSGDG